jgi:hypothetical protein
LFWKHTLPCLVLACSVAAAATTTTPAAAADPLTEAEVKQVVSATNGMAPVIERYQADWQQWAAERPDAGQQSDDPCIIPPDAKDAPGFDEMETVVQDNGFDSGEAYCRMSMRVYAACMADQMAQKDPNWRDKVANRDQYAEQASKQIDTSLAQLDADESLSPEQKAQVRAQLIGMREQMGSVAKSPMLAAVETVSDEDMATVKPHCADLMKIHDSLPRE